MLPHRLAQLEKIEARAPQVAEQIKAMAQRAANEAEFRPLGQPLGGHCQGD